MSKMVQTSSVDTHPIPAIMLISLCFVAVLGHWLVAKIIIGISLFSEVLKLVQLELL